MSRITAVLRALLAPLGPGARALMLRLISRFGWKPVTAGAVLMVYAAVRYRTWIVWMLIAFAVAAWMHAPNPTESKPSKAGEQPPTPDTEAVRRLLLDLIGDATGVHLRVVLAHLQEHGQWQGRTVADLRQHLEALGIPIDPKLKVGGVPTRGVRRADLEALSPPEETEVSPDHHLPA